MAIIPWTHVLSPIILGTLGSLYFYPPAVITAESQTTHCYPYIYTLNDTVPNAKCFVVGGKEGRFLQVGNRTEGEAEAGGEGEGGDKRELKRDEAEGGQGGRERVVIPGLWDGHGHLLQLGEMLGSVKLYGAGSTEGMCVVLCIFGKLKPNLSQRDHPSLSRLLLSLLKDCNRSPHPHRIPPQSQPHSGHLRKLDPRNRMGPVPPFPSVLFLPRSSDAHSLRSQLPAFGG